MHAKKFAREAPFMEAYYIWLPRKSSQKPVLSSLTENRSKKGQSNTAPFKTPSWGFAGSSSLGKPRQRKERGDEKKPSLKLGGKHQEWSTWRESNPCTQLGKLVFYH